MYSVEHEDGTRDASVEEEFAGGIETKAGPLISRLICCAREGRNLNISYEEKKTLAEFMHIQYARTRISCNILMNPNVSASVTSMWEAKWGHLTDEEKEMLDNEKQSWLNYLKGGVRNDLETFRIRMSQKIGVMFIQKPRKSFIIGDYPIIRNENERGSSKLEDVGVLEMLPIAHDVIVYFGRENGRQEREIVDENNVIRNINEEILKLSNAIAGRSKDLLMSLSKTPAARQPSVRWDSSIDDLLAKIKKENSSPFE